MRLRDDCARRGGGSGESRSPAPPLRTGGDMDLDRWLTRAAADLATSDRITDGGGWTIFENTRRRSPAAAASFATSF